MLYRFFRWILFRFDAEFVHNLASFWIKLVPGISIKATGQHSNLKVELFGKDIPCPVAMAAGFDKNGDLVNGLCGYGFGYVETGTYTLAMQPGNPKPRIFRIPQKSALFNRMGFNNHGIAEGLRNLSHARFPYAISIGKSKNTSVDKAIDDYRNILAEIEKIEAVEMRNLILYIAINISSPNTPDLRKLQNRRSVAELVKACKKITKIPVVIKFAPDFSSIREFEDLLKGAITAGVDGVIVTNTTTDPELVSCVPEHIRQAGGGLSGLPLRQKSLEYLNSAIGICKGKIPVISSGGVMSREDVWERLELGASIVQVYTGFIYNGPGFIGDCRDYIGEQIERAGFKTFGDFLAGRHKKQKRLK